MHQPKFIKYCGNIVPSIMETLPASVSYLEFEDTFNQAVDTLPSFLTEIKFGEDFNQPSDALPSSLSKLQFGLNFNQSINSKNNLT